MVQVWPVRPGRRYETRDQSLLQATSLPGWCPRAMRLLSQATSSRRKIKLPSTYPDRCARDLSIQEPGISNFEHAYVRITWDNALEKR